MGTPEDVATERHFTPPDKTTYTLSCEQCGEAFETVESFPQVQLCPKCAKLERLGYERKT